MCPRHPCRAAQVCGAPSSGIRPDCRIAALYLYISTGPRNRVKPNLPGAVEGCPGHAAQAARVRGTSPRAAPDTASRSRRSFFSLKRRAFSKRIFFCSHHYNRHCVLKNNPFSKNFKYTFSFWIKYTFQIEKSA